MRQRTTRAPAATLTTAPTTPDKPSQDTPRKQRSRNWATTFKRRATVLASQFQSLTSSPAPRQFSNQAEFRRYFLKTTRDQVIHDDEGNAFRLYQIVMNGDCGFASIAKGINIARGKSLATPPPPPAPTSARRRLSSWLRPAPPPPPTKLYQPDDIRVAMSNEIRKSKKSYLCNELFDSVFTEEQFNRLEREASRPGITGHWLGAVLGLLEHVLVAHALKVNICLYQFDLQKQTVRQFENVMVPKACCTVYLFFTGPAASGHFDTMVKLSDGTSARDGGKDRDGEDDEGDADLADVMTVRSV